MVCPYTSCTAFAPERCVVSAALLAGCASSQPQAALPAVRTQLEARGVAAVAWPMSDRDRADVDVSVRDLLTRDLTVDSAVQIALLNNRSLRATFEELGLSQARLAAATRLPNPSLDASVRWPSHAPRGPNVEFGVSVPLLEALLLPSHRRLAQGEVRQVQYAVSHAVLELSAQVRRAVYELLARQELRRQLAGLAETNAAAAEFAQRQFDAGNIARLDLLQLQATARAAEVAVLRSDAEVSAAREELNRLLGLGAGQTVWKLAGSLPALPSADALPADLETRARDTRLDLAAIRAQAALAERAFQLKQRTRLFPGEANVGLDTERETEGGRLTGPHASLEIPLFNQGQPELARLAAEWRQARDRAEALEAEIGSEVRLARDRLAAARRAVEFHTQTLLPQRQAVLDETLLHYNAMQKGVYELLAAKEQHQLAEQHAIEATRDYWLARVELDRALGAPLPTPVPSASPPAERSAQPAAEDHSHHHPGS